MDKKEKDTVLVIDMQNVYLKDQPWGCQSIERSIQNIHLLLKEIKEKQDDINIAFTAFYPDDNPIGDWQNYNEVNKEINDNPWMSAIIDEIKTYTDKYPLYKKSKYSSLTNEEVKQLAKNSKQLVICGVVSDCCVIATIFEAIDEGIHIVYLKDACSGLNEETEEAVITILSGLSYLHVDILSTQEYIDSIKNRI